MFKVDSMYSKNPAIYRSYDLMAIDYGFNAIVVEYDTGLIPTLQEGYIMRVVPIEGDGKVALNKELVYTHEDSDRIKIRFKRSDNMYSKGDVIAIAYVEEM